MTDVFKSQTVNVTNDKLKEIPTQPCKTFQSFEFIYDTLEIPHPYPLYVRNKT